MKINLVEECLKEKRNRIENEKKIKVSKKIKGTLSFRNLKLIQTLNTIDDIAYKIEESIEIIRQYKEFIDHNERFNNYIRLSYNKEVYRAISTIHKHAKRITTPQFKKLLELDIVLPSVINKTLEDRLAELGEYNSVYEKEQHEGNVVLNDFIIFIVQNSRRPNPNIPKERELALEYESHIRKSSVVKIREICNLLKSNRIELTFYEKVIIGDYIPQEILDKYIKDLEDKVIREGEISEEELKIARAIDRHGYKVSIDYLKDLIKMFVSLRDVTEDVDKLEKMSKSIRVTNRFGNIENKGTLLRRVSSNKKYLTPKLIERLLKIGVKVSDDLYSINEDGSINEKEQKDEFLLIDYFFSNDDFKILSDNEYLKIAEEYNGVPVKEIYAEAFKNNKTIKGVYCSELITSINASLSTSFIFRITRYSSSLDTTE